MSDCKNPRSNDIVAQAYELAQSGDYGSLAHVEKMLRKIGYPRAYVESHLEGAALRRSLRQMIKESSSIPAADGPTKG